MPAATCLTFAARFGSLNLVRDRMRVTTVGEPGRSSALFASLACCSAKHASRPWHGFCRGLHSLAGSAA